MVTSFRISQTRKTHLTTRGVTHAAVLASSLGPHSRHCRRDHAVILQSTRKCRHGDSAARGNSVGVDVSIGGGDTLKISVLRMSSLWKTEVSITVCFIACINHIPERGSGCLRRPIACQVPGRLVVATMNRATDRECRSGHLWYSEDKQSRD